MTKIIKVSNETYAALLRKKAEMSAVRGEVFSFSEVIGKVLAE